MVVKNSTGQTITQYNVQTGDAANNLNQVPPSTATFVLTSNGPSAQPSFQAVSASGSVMNFTVDAVTGTGVNPVVPNAGNVRVSADIVTQQGIPIQTQTPSPNKYNVEVQYCDSNATALGTKSGMAHFKSTDFTVNNTNGFVSLATPAVPFVSGTWTPTLFGATTAGTTTYTTTEGTYVQFGNLVWVRAFIRVSATTGTGTAMVGGLPYTIFNNTASFTNSNLGLSDSWLWPTGSTAPIFYGITGTTTGQMAMNGSGLTTQYMQMQSGSISIAFNFIYQVSA